MKDKKAEKTFEQNIDLQYLEELSDIISSNYNAFAHAYSFKIDNKKRRRRFEYYNLLCTCILRIRETAHYVCTYKFKQQNTCKQAFDFYEFINCLSIIFGCTESLLNIFGFKLKDSLAKKSCFLRSNITKQSDYSFFKFIRSAAVAHPDNTSHYSKISKRNNEIYPYAVWTQCSFDLLLSSKNKDADISLLSWASSERSQYKRYYLYINEFFCFINAVMNSISLVIAPVNTVVQQYKEKHRCKRLKNESDFNNYHEYLVYLRSRFVKLNTHKYEILDGGVALADHIISNTIITNAFKNYLKTRVKSLREMMIHNFDEIGFDTIFDELNLMNVIRNQCNDPSYVDQKFHDFLKREAICEIENNKFPCAFNDFVKYGKDPQSGNAAFWAVYKLFSCDIFFNKFKSYDNYKDFSYADIYEISLETIFFETIAKKQQ